MNKYLLRLGAAINLLFVAFYLASRVPMDEKLAAASPDIRASVSTLNIGMAFVVLIFGCLAFFRWRDLLTTRLGNLVAIAIAAFWFVRGASQLMFYEVSGADLPLVGLCLVVGLLHLIPALRAWKHGPPRPVENPVEQVSTFQERIARSRWPSYAVVVWCVVFGGIHLYWALGGGPEGFADFSMPSNRAAALARDPVYMGITWFVVLACVGASVVALAPFQKWTRRFPLWLLLTPLWIGFGLFMVRGLGNPIQTALEIAGGLPFGVEGGSAQAWARWLLMDAAIYSPWFILGGLAFGATAWSARWHREHIAAGEVAAAA